MKYKVIKYAGRPFYVVRYVDSGGNPRERTTQSKNRRTAERWAADFIAGLGHGQSHELTWKAFRARYEAQKLAGLPSAGTYRTALSHFETRQRPVMLSDGTSAALARFRDTMIAEGIPRTTAASYVKHVRAAINWAHREGLSRQSASVNAGSTSKMRGRPLTTEEFERMLRAVPKVVGRERAPTWRRVMLAMWTIGIRRGEILSLSWDDDTLIQIRGIERQSPQVFFPAHCHKARRDMLLPLLPDAVEWLRKGAKSQRKGLVFAELRGKRKRVRTADGVGRIVSAIGEKAKVITGRDPEGLPQYATAHDLRRSLGNRLAALPGVSTAAITMLMRHKSYETTLAHYTDLRVDQISAMLSAAMEKGCTLGCNPSDDQSPGNVVSSIVKEL